MCGGADDFFDLDNVSWLYRCALTDFEIISNWYD